jgi:hypothetical protein
LKATPQERAAAYLGRMPVSVAGQGGHVAAYNVALVAVRGFALSDADALDVLRDWNADCLPPWNEADLRHKIKSARQDGQRPFGYLLDKVDDARPLPPAERRSRWPTMRLPTAAEIARIAELRRLPVRAVLAAASLGWLKVGQVDGQACFILTEGTFAQARRIDGKPLALAKGDKIKAKTLPGSQGHFLGLQRLGWSSVRVLLVEGCIALLEGLALLERLDPHEGWAVVAATSASSRFASDPAALAALAGRQVTIVADNDKAGIEGADTWYSDLKAAGCSVRYLPAQPEGCKDLGDMIAAAYDPSELSFLLQ